MARDLRSGDRVRVVGGTSEVLAVESGSVQPVYNLEVVRRHDFFVGEAGALAHDAWPAEAVAAPFDRVPVLAAIAPARR